MSSWIKRREQIKPRSTDTLTEKLLKSRGISEDLIDDFLAPDISQENDYKLIKDIDRALDYVEEALVNNYNITISGDPDADGVTSLAILHNFLRDNFPNREYNYIYGQRDYGHGISKQVIKDLKNDEEDYIALINRNVNIISQTDLLIICDSSSSDREGIDFLLEQYPDLKIIILDHHEFINEQTEDYMTSLDRVVLVNIQRFDDESPNKSLSGAGVVYKFIKGINDRFEGLEREPHYYLDLVAVGMIGDVMNVRELENRYLISQGLQNVNNVGLTRILKGAKVNMYTYNSTDVGFSVAPLINGSARMGQIELAIQILLVENDKEAKPLRLQMDKLNKQRQELQRGLAEKYEQDLILTDKVLFVVDEDSNKGFNGLVAQTLSQKYQRPCFVVRNVNGMCYGSGRSYGGVNTKDLFNELGYVITEGHQQSHGIEFPFSKLDEMREYANDNIKDKAQTEQVFMYDIELEADEDLEMNIAEIQNLNYITGNGFPQITVMIKNVDVESRDVIGATKETVKFTCDNGLVLIKFKVNEEWHDEIDTFDTVRAVGTPNINIFYNFATKETTKTPQIIIMDIVKGES